eukprot:jgi/Ulvmu1/9289/UM050_0038.1
MSSRNAFVDEEAENESGSEEEAQDSSDDEDVDDDQQLQKEVADGFIVDEDEDEADEDEEDVDHRDSHKRKKKRRKRSQLLDLDDDDLALVEENTGRKIKRHKRVFKRQNEVIAPVGRDGLAREFGAEDSLADLEDFQDPIDDYQAGNGQRWGDVGPEDSFDEEAHEMDDFIEHDGETTDAEYKKRRRALAKSARAQGISMDAAEELLDIFGQDIETRTRLEEWELANEIDNGDGTRADVEDPEEDQGPLAMVDPMLMEQYHLTEKDEEVREVDCPERLFVEMHKIPSFELQGLADYIYSSLFGPDAPEQLIKWTVQDGVLEVEGVSGETPEQMETKYEGVQAHEISTWINDGIVENVKGFRLVRKLRGQQPDEPTWCTIEEWQNDEESQAALAASIREAIKLLFFKKLEVPVLAMFHKELMGELLCTRAREISDVVSAEAAEDMMKQGITFFPGAVTSDGRRIRRWDVLWAVYNQAFTYFELVQQRNAKLEQLQKTFEAAAATDTAASERYAELSSRLQQARNLDDLEAWAAYCRLIMPPPIDLASLAIDEPQQQLRPRKSTRYQAYIRADIGTLAGRLAMPTDHFAALVDTISHDHPRGNPDVLPPPTELLSSTPEEAVEIHVAVRMDVSDIQEQNDMSEEQKHRALQQAQYVLMQEISQHPLIRAKVKEIVTEIAVVSTTPTEVGTQVLTPFHKHGPVKRIREKPARAIIYDFPEQFLHMMAAEKEGLVKVTVEVPAHHQRDSLVEPFIALYSTNVEQDNEPMLNFYRQVITDAMQKLLVPEAIKALRKGLTEHGQKKVLQIIEDKFWCEATMPPLRLQYVAESPDDAPDDIAEGDLKREFLRGQKTCVVCWGDGSERRLENATHMVMLDARGYPLDVLRLPQLSGRIPVSPSLAVSLTEDDRKSDDVRKVVEFLDKHWPHLIVVGTASPECRQLQADLEKICDVEFTQDSRNEHLFPMKSFHVRLVDDNVAAIYESSRFATSDLKEHPRLVRRAVALGRACIEPLTVLCTLMSSAPAELLALQLHPLQGLLADGKREQAMRQLLLTAVSQIGVPVNECAQRDWVAPLLQFVPGLGPRKAHSVVKAIKSIPEHADDDNRIPGQTIVARDALRSSEQEDQDIDPNDPTTYARVLTPQVYNNAAPFLRVLNTADGDHEGNEDDNFHPRDDMRVHPRDDLALDHLAKVALDRDADTADDDYVLLATGVPDKVIAVDISVFDSMWSNTHPMPDGSPAPSRVSTLLDLSMELVRRYADFRRPERVPLTERELFWALTGESEQTLREGKLITARVIWVQQNVAGLVTDNGIMCFLDRQEANTVPKETLIGYLPHGAEVSARIIEIDYGAMRLRLSSKSGVLAESSRWEDEYLRSVDEFYHVLSDREQAEQDAAKRAKQKRRAIQNRPITHDRFANLSAAQVRKALIDPQWNGIEKFRQSFNPAGASEGDAVFHPSPKGSDRLSLSMRLFTRGNRVPVVQCIDLLETKSQKLGNHLTLGTPLRIGLFDYLDAASTEFEDLDDVLVNFVRPYVDRFRDVTLHKHYFAGGQIEVDAHLTQAFMGHAEYRLCLHWGEDVPASAHRPGIGWGMIVVKTSRSNPRHYHFRISHKGYYARFEGDDRSKHYANVAKLIAGMKTSLQSAASRAQRDRPHHYQQPDPGYAGMPYAPPSHHGGGHFVPGAAAPY